MIACTIPGCNDQTLVTEQDLTDHLEWHRRQNL
jgi:hypothetical protein